MSKTDDIPEEHYPCYFCSVPAIKKCSKCKKVAYCTIDCQKKDWKRHKAECCIEGQLEIIKLGDNLRDDRLVLKDSRVHGKGIFALEDIKKGDMLCFFEGQPLDVNVKIRMTRDNAGILDIVNAGEVFTKMKEHHGQYDRVMIIPGQKMNQGRLGNQSIQNNFGIGQFLNDGSFPKKLLDMWKLDFPMASRWLGEYVDESQKLTNCEMAGCFWFKASKDVRAGEELFCHYGFEFWLGKYFAETPDPAKRFLYNSLMNQDSKPFDLRKFYNYTSETKLSFLRDWIGVPEEQIKDPEMTLLTLSCEVNMMGDEEPVT